MTPSRGAWLAAVLGFGLVAANVAIKPSIDPILSRRMSDSARRAREWRGRVAPGLTLPWLEGGEVRVPDADGDMVALVFFTTWCDECGFELAEIAH